MELVSIKDAQKRLSIGRTKLWELCKSDDFPKLVTVVGSRKAFVASELDAWIASRIAARDGKAA